MKKERKLAIIGVGPRGLYALENFLQEIAGAIDPNHIQLFLFEKTGNFGNGQVYDIHQAKTNWLNVSERMLNLKERPFVQWGTIELPGFPSYHTWAGFEPEDQAPDTPDIYPPRSKLGEYLQARFASLICPLQEHKIVELYTDEVLAVEIIQDGFEIVTQSDESCRTQEILLTIGHQPTLPSEQLQEWAEVSHQNDGISFYEDPYPLETYLKNVEIHLEGNIGIRGFGLAMIDVARGIASHVGRFEVINEHTRECIYHRHPNQKGKLIPFSLDGLPPVPKPLNAKIDGLYRPSEEALAAFGKIIGNPENQKSAENQLFMIHAILPLVAEIYFKLPHTYNTKNLDKNLVKYLAQKWLLDERFENPVFVPTDQSADKLIREFVKMATGEGSISLDFCIGQVWRHCQPTIYEQFSFNHCNETVFAEIIALDERMKRYAYGPPVESMQQMLALTASGLMALTFVNNPEINLSSKGWDFKNDETAHVRTMINSVLDPPKIVEVTAPLVKNLLSNNLMEVVHDDYGVMTTEEGVLIPSKETNIKPIALLGRLAKGTIIGVDAISECFGNRPKIWAASAGRPTTINY